MRDVRITVMRMVRHNDLIEIYENHIEHACDMVVGREFVSVAHKMPDGFCVSAWESISSFVLALACGGENFFDGWMKNKKSAMLSCNDGFRPVSFLLETI